MQVHGRDIWGKGSKTRVEPAGGAAQKPLFETQGNLWAPSWILGYRALGRVLLVLLTTTKGSFESSSLFVV